MAAAKQRENEDRTGEVEKELTPEELSERAELLVQELKAAEALEQKKGTHVAKWNEQLRLHDTTIKRLTTELDTGRAWIPAQTDMWSGDGDDGGDDGEKPAKKRRGRRAAQPAEASA